MNKSQMFPTSIEEIANVIALEEWGNFGFKDCQRFRSRVMSRLTDIAEDSMAEFHDIIFLDDDTGNARFFIDWRITPSEEA